MVIKSCFLKNFGLLLPRKVRKREIKHRFMFYDQNILECHSTLMFHIFSEHQNTSNTGSFNRRKIDQLKFPSPFCNNNHSLKSNISSSTIIQFKTLQFQSHSSMNKQNFQQHRNKHHKINGSLLFNNYKIFRCNRHHHHHHPDNTSTQLQAP